MVRRGLTKKVPVKQGYVEKERGKSVDFAGKYC